MLIGGAGYIAPRHFRAIRETGNTLSAVFDIADSLRGLDEYFPEAEFFPGAAYLGDFLTQQKEQGTPVDYVVVCSPNHLHKEHILAGLYAGAEVISEKPVVVHPADLEILAAAEKETGKKVYTIMQLRLHPAIKALKQKVEAAPAGKHYQVQLQYITARGRWYHKSWKGNPAKSGGIAVNIGIHLFDMLHWIFGGVKETMVRSCNDITAGGRLVLEKAAVDWTLSIDAAALPAAVAEKGKKVYRVMKVDEEVLEFSEGFADLHTSSYREILSGRGFGLDEVRSSLLLANEIGLLSLHSVRS